MMTPRNNVIVAIIAWLVAIALTAMVIDRPLAIYLRDSGIAMWVDSHETLKTVLKFPGDYKFTLAVAIFAAIASPLRWRAAGFIALAALVSGLNGFVKWVAGRTRPFELKIFDATNHRIASPFALSPFRGGIPGIIESKNLCFPSGHAALAFATAAALAMLFPRSKWRWIGYVLATIVAAERVAENAHWASDCVAAAALGIGGVHLLRWLVERLMPQHRHE